MGRYCLALLLLLSDLLSLQAATAPNIVLVLIDDQAWNGTSVQMHPALPNSRSDFYQTPRLEEFAAQGMRFYNGYASQSMCSPTRAAILTGRSPAQLQMTDLPISYPGHERWEGHQSRLPLTAPAAEALQPDIFSLPQIINQANPDYVTAHFGKWHLDATTALFPEDVGYDTSVRKAPYAPMESDPKDVFHLANSANIFMEENVASSKPFFLQLSHYAVHDPTESRQVLRDKYAALPPGAIHSSIPYAAMTEDLDTSFGMVLDKLDQLGIRENTYVIYTSDNGAPIPVSSSYPLYRGKSTLREGGIRVPFIVSGPGVAAGGFSSVPVTTTDLYSTIASLAGNSAGLPSNVEGADFSPLLHNSGMLPSGMDHLARNYHEGGEIYWHWPQYFGPSSSFRVKPSSAVRDGDYKLFVEYGENGAPETVALYNLATDISESFNLASSMPEKKAELRAKLSNYLETVDASFAYDVKTPATMNWDVSVPGNVPEGWRSTIDLKYKGRETWKLGAGAREPQLRESEHFQPGLADQAFYFDGGDVMQRTFFHVGDPGPRRNSPHVGTPDFDRSASMEFWVRLDSLSQNQTLFESGDGTSGLSLTLGDADADGKSNDLRFRVLGDTGTNQGGAAVLKDLTVTTKIDRFANPLADYVHLAAVFNDDPQNRYAELYVNGARAGRIDGLLGENESLQWDDYDMAGLGNTGGSGLGASGGSGELPFSGGFRGSMAQVRFNNFANNPSEVLSSYNSALHPVNSGMILVAGDVEIPAHRPSDVTLRTFESAQLAVMHERTDVLDSSLAVDALIHSGVTLNGGGVPTSGLLSPGTKFSSYLLHFDPVADQPTTNHIAGSIAFTGEVLGLIWGQQTLGATDSILGTIGNFGNGSSRGLNLAQHGSLTISADQRTLSFDLQTLGDDMLQFRVLTSFVESADFNDDGFVTDNDLVSWQGSFGINDGGDADGDGDTDGRDFLIWQRQYVPLPPASSDFNQDQFFDELDLTTWQAAYGSHRGGDADHDGDTDGRDFLIWQRQFHEPTADFDGNGLVDSVDLASWQLAYGNNAGGDANGDDDTDGRDFLYWQRQFTTASQVSSMAVPEPSGYLLMVSLLGGLICCRPRKLVVSR
ncbi:MAG: sulfatase-like hydrolase/transferase [Bythopirellula sp.]|nr:sulfatase-like hydrolase/transferase [Bythopirellula sp.]